MPPAHEDDDDGDNVANDDDDDDVVCGAPCDYEQPTAKCPALGSCVCVFALLWSQREREEERPRFSSVPGRN